MTTQRLHYLLRAAEGRHYPSWMTFLGNYGWGNAAWLPRHRVLKRRRHRVLRAHSLLMRERREEARSWNGTNYPGYDYNLMQMRAERNERMREQP